MTSTCRWLMVLAFATVVTTPMSGAPMRRAITSIKSAPGLEYCPCPLAAAPKIKRGVTNTIVLTGVGLANAGLVLTSHRIVGRVTQKSEREVTITLTPPADAELLPRVITIMAGPDNVGGLGVHVVRQGRITSVSPESISGGRLTTVTVSGTDIGSAALREGDRDFRKIVSRTDSEVRLELRPTDTQTQMILDLGEKLGTQFLPWRKLEVKVAATVATGTSGCQPFSSARSGAELSSPANGLIFDPLTSSQTARRVEFKWTRAQNLGVTSPDESHVLEYRIAGASTWTRRTVEGFTYSLDLPKGKYEWKVTNVNCTTTSVVAGPWTFTIQ